MYTETLYKVYSYLERYDKINIYKIKLTFKLSFAADLFFLTLYSITVVAQSVKMRMY